MRAILVAMFVMCLGPAGAAADEDDPKLERALTAPSPLVLADEDDPKLARGAPGVHKPFSWNIKHPVPRFKLAYRRLSTSGLDNDTIDFNVTELDYYPFSGWFRLGMDTELGIGADKYSSWFFTVGAALGVQWPGRVTPFIDGRFVAGLIGGSYSGQSAVSWVYMGGLETGIELYVASRFYFTAALGWAHPVFSGIDVAYVRAHPLLDPQRKEFSNDTFTLKVGLGL